MEIDQCGQSLVADTAKMCGQETEQRAEAGSNQGSGNSDNQAEAQGKHKPAEDVPPQFIRP
ncbi:hypothetical protein GCM10010869_05240 [Mesorhizobium tianshanense]|nr:hypothetical protein GCM10010869_05240 [Mesorhizobium tianshanense]